jgi:hypothetical protein
MLKLKYDYTNNGFCRVHYNCENSQGQELNYCAQDEGRDVNFYRCTGGDHNEPIYLVQPDEAPPLSPGDTETDKIVNAWIAKKWVVNNG